MVGAGQVFEGRFRLDAVLGDGVESTVWASTTSAGARVALKIFEPRAAAAAALAAAHRRAARVRHPAFVEIEEIGQASAGALFIVTKLLDALALRSVLDRQGPLASPWALSIASQILEALAAAHAQGLAHGNFKPTSVVLTAPPGPGSTVRILNLGLSRPIVAGASAAAPRRVVGVLDYVAPEELRQPGGPTTPRGDVFACGILLYEMLTGQLPLAPLTPQDRTIDAKLADRIAYYRSGRAVPIPAETFRGFSAELVEVVRQATLVDAARRFGDAGLMLAALRAVARATPGAMPDLADEASIDTDVDARDQGFVDLSKTVVSEPLFGYEEEPRRAAGPGAPAGQPPPARAPFGPDIPTVILEPADDESTLETSVDGDEMGKTTILSADRPGRADLFADPFAAQAGAGGGEQGIAVARTMVQEPSQPAEARTMILEPGGQGEAQPAGPPAPQGRQEPVAVAPQPWPVGPGAAPAWMHAPPRPGPQAQPALPGAAGATDARRGRRRLVAAVIALVVFAIGLFVVAAAAWTLALR